MILLDTSVLVACLAAPQKLGPRLLKRLTDKPAAYFSSLSIAEITLKAGKLSSVDVTDLPKKAQSLGFAELPYFSSHTAATQRFWQLLHSDPFDWMLLAQAASQECNFYTHDLRLLRLGLDFVRDASE